VGTNHKKGRRPPAPRLRKDPPSSGILLGQKSQPGPQGLLGGSFLSQSRIVPSQELFKTAARHKMDLYLGDPRFKLVFSGSFPNFKGTHQRPVLSAGINSDGGSDKKSERGLAALD